MDPAIVSQSVLVHVKASGELVEDPLLLPTISLALTHIHGEKVGFLYVGFSLESCMEHSLGNSDLKKILSLD